ncbi:MAG: toll/interleukin-1 receptor domain-containing protein [Pseudomonadota bacterium]
MPDVFISYAREDRDWAEQVRGALEARGFDVWSDAGLTTGGQFSTELQSRLDSAKAVLVLWSRSSVVSSFVRDEAAYARDNDKLVPVKIEDTDLPLGFRQFHTTDLMGWGGNPASQTIANLCTRLSELTGVDFKTRINSKENRWLKLSREDARRHRLWGFSGSLLAIYLAFIVSFAISMILHFSAYDQLMAQIEFERQSGVSPMPPLQGWATADEYASVQLRGIVVQAVWFIPFLVLPLIRLRFYPWIAAVSVCFGQLLWPAFWLPQVQPISTFLLPQLNSLLAIVGISAFLVLSERVRLNYALEVRNRLLD